MLEGIIYILGLCTPITLMIGVALGFFLYRKNDFVQRLLTWFITALLSLELASRYAWITIDNNLYFLTLSALVEFSFYGVLYYHLLSLKDHKWIVFLLVPVFLYLLFQTVTLSINVDPNQHNLYDRLIAGGGIMILALLFIKRSLTSETDFPRWYKLLNAVILTYIVIDMFMALTINFMVNAPKPLVFFFWFMRMLFLLLLYLTLVKVVWNNGSRKKRKLFG